MKKYLIAIVSTSLLSVSSSYASHGVDPTDDGRLYYIRNKYGNVLNCFDASNTQKHNKVEHIQYNHNSTREDQKFFLQPTGDGYKYIRSRFGNV